MLRGIYKAWKRRAELDSTRQFTNNLQVWLAVFAFCALIVVEIGRPIWGRWQVIIELSSFQWFLFIVGSALVFIFLILGVIALYKLFKLLYHAIYGQKLQYNPKDLKTIPDNVLAVITPIKDGATIEDCRDALARLITFHRDAKGKVKAEVEKRIAEYQSILNELEANT